MRFTCIPRCLLHFFLASDFVRIGWSDQRIVFLFSLFEFGPELATLTDSAFSFVLFCVGGIQDRDGKFPLLS